jgi:DNA-binding winged helix-turn-helix (wHTH) protein
VPLNRLRSSRLQPFFEEVRAIKVTLILMEWLDQLPIHTIECRYSTMAGQVIAAAAQSSWLMDATEAMANALGLESAFTTRLHALSRRVAHGLNAAFTDLAAETGLTRGQCLNLAEAGLHTPEALQSATEVVLRDLVPVDKIPAVRMWCKGRITGSLLEETDPNPPSAGLLLVVDDRRPNEIVLDGYTIPLQAKQYQLIRLLAATPGDCVAYETIYDELWGEAIVEQNQIHYQKRTLLQRVREYCPEWEERLIETRNKCGFVLALAPQAVSCLSRELTQSA